MIAVDMRVLTAITLFYASNEPKSVLARDIGDCRDNLRNSWSVFLIVYANDVVWSDLTKKIQPYIIVLNRTKEGIDMFFWDQHKTITSCYEMITRTVCAKYQLTQMEYDILMFLHSNPKHNTAADIVKVRKSTKSHVSISLKELENRGLIKKVQSAENKKHIEIALLSDADPIIEAGTEAQKKFAQNVLKGLTEEEKHICITVFNKICSNADEYMKNNME